MLRSLSTKKLLSKKVESSWVRRITKEVNVFSLILQPLRSVFHYFGSSKLGLLTLLFVCTWLLSSAPLFAANGPMVISGLKVTRISIPPTLGSWYTNGINKTYNDAGFNLNAPTSNSQGAFSYSSSNPAVATVQGNQVILIGAGTATLTATQVAQGVYASATVTTQLSVGRDSAGLSFPQATYSATMGSAFNAPVASKTGKSADKVVGSSASITYSSSNTNVARVDSNSGGITLIGAGSTQISANLAADTNYQAATASYTLSINQAVQSLSFDALTDQAYGAAPLTLTASASSQLPVSFSSQTPAVCTISGKTLTLIASGGCRVRASQEGNGTYAAASPIERSFTISAPKLTLTPSSLTNGTYNTAYSVNLDTSGGVAPYRYNLSSGVLPAGLTLNSGQVNAQVAGTPSAAGDASFTITATDANGFAASQAYTVSIAKELASLSFPQTSYSATMGSLFNSPIAVKTGKSADSNTGSTGVMTYNSSNAAVATIDTNSGVITLVGAGTTTITANLAADTNYQTASTTYTLTVSQASQTIAFANLADQAYGSAPITLNTTASSGLTVTHTSQTTAVCTVTNNILTLIANGRCTVRAAQAGNTIYSAAETIERSFNVGSATLIITPNTLGNGLYNTAYSANLKASGGVEPYVYTTSTGTLPAGLNLNNNGQISGIASAAGSSSFTVDATDANGFKASQAYTLVIAKELAGLSFAQTTYSATMGSPFNAPTASKTGKSADSSTGSKGTISYSSGNTAVATIDANSGAVTLVGAGSTVITANLSADANYQAATTTYTLTVSQVAQTITFAALTDQAYGVAPITVSATASSQLEVTFSSQTTNICTVSGKTVTIIASGVCTVRASQAGNATYGAAAVVDRSFTISQPVLTLQPNSLNNGTYNTAYSVTLSASGGVAPYQYSITQGSLPATLSLSPSGATAGQITGTPTAAGDSSLTVEVKDANGFTASQAYNLNIAKEVAGLSFPQASYNAVLSSGFNAPTASKTGKSADSATGSKGAISYSSSNVLAATVDVASGAVTLVGPGSATITANLAADSNYQSAAASYVLTVQVTTTTTLTSSATTPTGEAPFTLTARVTGNMPTGTVKFYDGNTVLGTAAVNEQAMAVFNATLNAGAHTIKAIYDGDATNLTSTSTDMQLTVNTALTAKVNTPNQTGNKGTTLVAFIPVSGLGGSTPLSYTINPALPSGLNFNASTGEVSGKPTNAQAATDYTVTITDANNVTANGKWTLTITEQQPLDQPMVVVLQDAGVGTFNLPADKIIKEMKVWVVGAGGAGAVASPGGTGSGGGAGGVAYKLWTAVTGSNLTGQITYSIGVGGKSTTGIGLAGGGTSASFNGATLNGGGGNGGWPHISGTYPTEGGRYSGGDGGANGGTGGASQSSSRNGSSGGSIGGVNGSFVPGVSRNPAYPATTISGSDGIIPADVNGLKAALVAANVGWASIDAWGAGCASVGCVSAASGLGLGQGGGGGGGGVGGWLPGSTDSFTSDEGRGSMFSGGDGNKGGGGGGTGYNTSFAKAGNGGDGFIVIQLK